MPALTYDEAVAQRAVFWGKYLVSDGVSLPLVAHCIDVGKVFRGLCELNSIRRMLVRAARRELTAVDFDRLAVLASWHDTGKSNLGFQLKVFSKQSYRASHISELAPILDLQAMDVQLAQRFCDALLSGTEAWFPDGDPYSYLMAIFSHHGRPLKFSGHVTGRYQSAKRWWRPLGPWDPMQQVGVLAEAARTVFPCAFLQSSTPLPDTAVFEHCFAGLVTLADWLGSHRHWFPIMDTTVAQRSDRDDQTVPKVLAAVGLDVEPVRLAAFSAGTDFASRFGQAPRPLQHAIDALDPEDENVRLLVAESETGSGKTEAALNWFIKLFMARKVDSLYFALPTRVAASELYTRVCNIVERWYPNSAQRPVTVLAVPGYTKMDGMPVESRFPTPAEGNVWTEDSLDATRERQWAAERPKRFLGAAVAVGTVDQALLSVVQTAHAHLRSVCLARSLLVVDEVHASDVYMGRLIGEALRHHLEVGGYAMLLSATLGSSARVRFIHASTGQPQPEQNLGEEERKPYPSLTLADGQVRAVSGVSGGRKVEIRRLPILADLPLVAATIGEALHAGARVLVVVNTVGRANTLHRALEERGDIDSSWVFACRGVACPHHGRFAPEDRALVDAAVSRRFGKESPPGPVVIVGTQTLEQSLDIDADLLVTDLAPADVILQRVGRLHRHSRPRPAAYARPACIVLELPDGGLESGLNDKGQVLPTYRGYGFGSVYEDLRTLELTRRLFAQSPVIRIPEDNRRLVEGITHAEVLSSLTGEKWERHGYAVTGRGIADRLAASLGLVPFHEHFGTFEFHEQVATRLGVGTLQLPLSRPAPGAFGTEIHHMLIPGHLAPRNPEDHVTVEEERPDALVLRCGPARYRYSRFGLEKL